MAIVKKPAAAMTTANNKQKGLNPKVSDLLNFQIEVEAVSAYIYKAAATWANINGYLGTSKFYDHHYHEELKHMYRIYDYMLERNCFPETPEIKQPKLTYNGLHDLLQASLKHEKYVTSTYNDLAPILWNEKDYMTFTWMQWYLQEQIEEEDIFQTFLDQYDILMKDGETGLGLMELDEIIEEKYEELKG